MFVMGISHKEDQGVLVMGSGDSFHHPTNKVQPLSQQPGEQMHKQGWSRQRYFHHIFRINISWRLECSIWISWYWTVPSKTFPNSVVQWLRKHIKTFAAAHWGALWGPQQRCRGAYRYLVMALGWARVCKYGYPGDSLPSSLKLTSKPFVWENVQEHKHPLTNKMRTKQAAQDRIN